MKRIQQTLVLLAVLLTLGRMRTGAAENQLSGCSQQNGSGATLANQNVERAFYCT
jgi:hypothetical protein